MHILKRGFVTGVRYSDEVLEPIVILYVAAVGPNFVLMDDNARPYRDDIVDDYLESEEIARMAWSAYSPDLNPIENIWDTLGHAVYSRFPPPATLIDLETVLQEEWRSLNSAVVDHLIKSMFRRKDLKVRGTYKEQVADYEGLDISIVRFARKFKNLYRWCGHRGERKDGGRRKKVKKGNIMVEREDMAE
ncbi:transposable element Tcb1 transposase [Trichonephila clavipes]|uniref:Transposable element Tcb1 transposase n=1 Tax=Trichonephila clavipes TaxID=2585209 RepID=A0A8X6RLH1_TRICX|nr:transposable element Tcb1 transposase [Trichonephila clavipes]